MSSKKSNTGTATTAPENVHTPRANASNTIVSPVLKTSPVIAADVFKALPRFYQSALTVLERSGKCTIEEV